jgi:pyrrolysine biosynthesis protein PylD
MTRLARCDVEEIERELDGYDAGLVRRTGRTLRQIAAASAGITEQELIAEASSYLAAVVPITAGEGVIECFAQSVRGILTYLGCRAFVTGETDVAGIAEGVAAGAEILFMADELRFVALNLRSGAISDNGEATGRGYVAALAGLAGGLSGEPVLVLGAGPVGCGAIALLREQGSRPVVYDIDADKSRRVGKSTGALVADDLREALAKYRCIVEATPQGSFIDRDDLRPDALVAAPGVPLGLTACAQAAMEDRVVWDPLQIGVAAMLALAVGSGQP